MKIYQSESHQLQDLKNCQEEEGPSSFFQTKKTTVATHSLCKTSECLFRLSTKNGEYVYVRPNDIVLIESCDHLVKAYIGFNNEVKKAVRNSTLKDFLQMLPEEKFMRIGRFCAVNIHRLSGGNCNTQTFEFDFTISVKLAHSVSPRIFSTIGK
ncbi:LytTR family DNA-binding domain-containing protein [Chitinophagaceae bacterium 26-R-25]|nr:LytTR family DNA-binding domain-containing protein [Chitinophagaceae bacterium 26-R-25]